MIYDTKYHLKDLQKTAKICATLIQRYRWLIDSYVLDFFVDDHWSKIPNNLKIFLDQATPEDLSNLIELEVDNKKYPEKNINSKVVWPLEILALKAAIKTFSLKRTPITKSQLIENLGGGKLQNNCDHIKVDDEAWPVDCTEELTVQGGQHKGLKHVFRKHIKPKKQHEIVRMSQLALLLSDKTGERNKLDIGAGKILMKCSKSMTNFEAFSFIKHHKPPFSGLKIVI